MKFVPTHSQIIGRLVIKKSESKIIRVDATRVTKFVFVDAMGPVAAEAGVKVGDLVVVTALKSIVLDAGMIYMPLIEEKDIALFVTDVSLDDLLVQIPSGGDFVPFDSPEAAQSLGAIEAEAA